MEQYPVKGPPTSAYYVPEFLTVEEEQRILNDIQRLPSSKWTTLTHRRLLSLPSVLTGPSKDLLMAAPLPEFLVRPAKNFESLGIFRDSPHKSPNHVLVNEYEPGQGIMPHTDGPAYHPVTATISLGSHTVLDIYAKTAEGEREATPSWRILQEPRSLLVTTSDMYKDTLHGIAERQEDHDLNPESVANWQLLGDTGPFASGTAARGTRVSLTYRDVRKVAKLGGALKFMNKR
jgi:alkylated DNA repair protein alkB homolog 6